MTTSGLRRWPLATGRPETWTAGQRTRRDELLVHRPQAVTPFEGTQLRAECPCPSTGTSQPHVWISSGGRTDLMNAVNTACGRAIGRRAALGPPRGEGIAPWGLIVSRSFAMLARRHRTGHIPAVAAKSKRSAHIFRACTSARRATHCATTACAREYFSREVFAASARNSRCAASVYARNKHAAMR